MRVEIVTIGDELLLGYTIDTNAAHLARELAALGVEIVRRTTVGDAADDIAAGVRDALERTGAVITTGGLGPTADDMTKPAIASLFGRRMYLHQAHLEWLRERWRRRFDRPLPKSNEQQAMVPEGATLLKNDYGSAPGIWLEDDRGRWVAMLPGVPREMRGMLSDVLVPTLASRAGNGAGAATVVRSRTLRTTGIAESALADALGDLASGVDGLPLAYLPGWEGVDLRLTARGMRARDADEGLARGAAAIRARVGEWIYGEGADDLAATVIEGMRRTGARLAVGESCTGGMLGARITAISGSSDVFVGGVIAYDNEVKVGQLGVQAETLRAAGAVSEPVVREMARGARERLAADFGVAITGVAGPGGGTEDKPVGTVWIGIDGRAHGDARRFSLIGDRDEIRRRATQAALEMVRRRLEKEAP